MVKMALQKLTRKHTPACPTSRIHVLVDLVVDFVRFLVILLVRGACEETIFVVWILKLSVVGPHPTNQSALPVVPFNYSKFKLTVSQITTCSIPSHVLKTLMSQNKSGLLGPASLEVLASSFPALVAAASRRGYTALRT
jgi:hypothetical protein